MKKTVILALLTSVMLLFVGCDALGLTDDDDNNDFDLYGSYWGTMTVFGNDYDMCLDVKEGGITFYSTAGTYGPYTNVAYLENSEDNWTFATYDEDDTDHAGTPSTTGTFTEGDSTTCIATIAAMGVDTNTLTSGDDYNGEYDS